MGSRLTMRIDSSFLLFFSLLPSLPLSPFRDLAFLLDNRQTSKAAEDSSLDLTNGHHLDFWQA